jgi:hypothetical protein
LVDGLTQNDTQPRSKMANPFADLDNLLKKDEES